MLQLHFFFCLNFFKLQWYNLSSRWGESVWLPNNQQTTFLFEWHVVCFHFITTQFVFTGVDRWHRFEHRFERLFVR